MAYRIFVLCACVCHIVFGQLVFECETVGKTPGTCVGITQCEPYLKLLASAGSKPEVKDLLRKSLCGYDGTTPKVCCPRATATTRVVSDVGKALKEDTDYIFAFPSPPECGISNASFGRIVGGVDAKLGDLPWMALLGYSVRGAPTNWLCGGSLISARHVLTAAHCIHNQETSLYVVRLGELDLAREDEGAVPVDVLIKRNIKHEAYNHESFENDIGLIVLQNEVQFTDLIRPICIPTDSRFRSVDFVGWTPLVAGWGKLSARGAKATHLQVLQLPVLTNEVCVQRYAAYEAQVIDQRVLCAGYTSGGKDSCSGDSGGPLMQPIPVNLTSVYYQLGVVSFGPRECALPGLPGIYTRITSFVPWLQRQVLGAV
ncbi:venom protease [Bicyclus anynana]|uniref:CLIP domain-containing serine protease n=1 Tax=Bicyclus anynana TaxID=110368 RepID=A0A6J1P879_BICAN|nr:venom protease [Bicyclus anynana]